MTSYEDQLDALEAELQSLFDRDREIRKQRRDIWKKQQEEWERNAGDPQENDLVRLRSKYGELTENTVLYVTKRYNSDDGIGGIQRYAQCRTFTGGGEFGVPVHLVVRIPSEDQSLGKRWITLSEELYSLEQDIQESAHVFISLV